MLVQGSGIGSQLQLEAQLQQLVKLGMKASDTFYLSKVEKKLGHLEYH